MAEEVISVIIAAYNVEEWIRKCVKSVINQTYRNIEIIVINDGSTDDTLKICKELAKQDSRINIITQNNRGLSEARNAGIKEATGSILTFVDGDDSLVPDALEIAVKKMCDADICTFQYAFVDNSGLDLKRVLRNEEEVIMDSRKALESMFIDNSFGGVVSWGKLYRTSLFRKNNISFPCGKYHEDCFTTYKLYYYAKKIVYIPYIGYLYLQRENSIVHSGFKEKHLDKIIAADECLKFIQDYRPESYIYAECAAIHWYLQVANRIIRYDNLKNENLLDIREKIRRNNYKNNPFLGRKYKILCEIYSKSFFVYGLLLKMFKAEEK